MLLGGREVNLDVALPLRIRDWREMKKRGVSLDEFRKGNADVDSMALLVGYVLDKCGAEKGLVDDLLLTEVTNVLNAITEAEVKEIDRPT